MSQKRRSEYPGRERPDEEKYFDEVVYQTEEKVQKPADFRRRKKRRRRYRRWLPVILVAGSILAVFFLLCYLVMVLFQVKQIQVTGNQYCSVSEIQEWIRKDPYAKNSLYIFWKFNKEDIEQLPSVESVEVKIKEPHKVEVIVKEKAFIGFVDYQNEFLYFDKEGIASFVTTDLIPGAVYVQGLTLLNSESRLGEPVAVEDSGLFAEVREVLLLSKKLEMLSDRVVCENGDIMLHFGNVRASLGSGGFQHKLAQIPPILEKMAELYAGQPGILHLENFDSSSTSVRFEPDNGQ